MAGVARKKKVNGEKACFLAVVPKSLLEMWGAELDKQQDLKHGIAYGPNIEEAEIDPWDIVVTTYGTIATQRATLKQTQYEWMCGFKGDAFLVNEATRRRWEAEGRAGDSPRLEYQIQNFPLFAKIYDGLIMVWNRHTRYSRSLFDIQAKSRIAMTGTPMRNTDWDFFSILRFVGLHLFCKGAWFKETFMKGRKKAAEKRLDEFEQQKTTFPVDLAAYVFRAIGIRRERSGTIEGKPISGTRKEV